VGVKATDLIPDVRNANKGTQRGLALLDKSLRELGAGRSILVDKHGRVIAGNKTLQAAVDIGLEDMILVPSDGSRLVAVQRTDLDLETDANARQLAWADNRVGELDLDWDVTKLLEDIGAGMDLDGMFKPDELEELLRNAGLQPEPVDAEAQVDKAEELRVKWGVALGDLWRIGEHRLVCGDCTDRVVVERVMGGERADCVFTSPPYAVGVDYGEYQDTIENLRVMLPKVAELWRDCVVRDGGFAVVNFGDIVSASKIVGTDGPSEYPMALEYWPIFRAAGWVLWSRRIWCKPGAGTGSMQCISSNRAATNWEHLWTWRIAGPQMFTKQTTGKYPSQNGWIDSSHGEGLAVGLKDHGAGMPPLPAMFSVANHSLSGGIVHEPYCGTGTTMVACQNLGRRCRACEISAGYVAVALERMATAFPGIAIERLT